VFPGGLGSTHPGLGGAGAAARPPIGGFATRGDHRLPCRSGPYFMAFVVRFLVRFAMNGSARCLRIVDLTHSVATRHGEVPKFHSRAAIRLKVAGGAVVERGQRDSARCARSTCWSMRRQLVSMNTVFTLKHPYRDAPSDAAAAISMLTGAR